jgi:prepilin-type N-terminal cleavage/methylation domain-containing protein
MNRTTKTTIFRCGKAPIRVRRHPCRRSGLTLLEMLVVLVILVATATMIVPIVGGFGSKSQQVSTRENFARLQELLVNQYKADMGELPRPGSLGLSANPPRNDHPQLRYLFINPDTENITNTTGTNFLSARVWRGPYVLHRGSRLPSTSSSSPDPFFGVTPDPTVFGIGDVVDSQGNITSPGDPTVIDAWGHPVVIQVPSDPTYSRLVSAGPNGKIDTLESVNMPDNTSTATGRGDDVLFFLYRADQYDTNKVLTLGP